MSLNKSPEKRHIGGEASTSGPSLKDFTSSGTHPVSLTHGDGMSLPADEDLTSGFQRLHQIYHDLLTYHYAARCQLFG
ncbi:hypothetical protein G6F56_013352 [Rhizopus delemar]|nr:hypothetical protein G6F56_013352 [Rhizopus delemar]